MKITKRCDYALRALIYFTYCQDMRQYKVTGKEIANHLKIPAKVLATVLLQLRQGQIIRSIRGKQGGYLLDKSPNDITFYDIAVIIDGPPQPYHHEFTDASTNTSVNAAQVIKTTVEQIETVAMATMRATTLRELTTSFRKLLNEDQSYSI